MRRNYRSLFFISGAALLAACGGSGGNDAPISVVPGGTPTPAPTPTPTPSATPTPTPTPTNTGTTLMTTQGTVSLIATESVVSFSRSNGRVTRGTYQFAPVENEIRYTRSTESYVGPTAFINSVRCTPIADAFDNRNRKPARSDQSYTYYEFADFGTTNAFLRSNPGPTNPTIALSYSEIGSFLGSCVDTSDGQSNYQFYTLAFGLRTNSSGEPSTGAVVYKGIALGIAIAPGSGRVYNIRGTFDFNADYGTKLYSGGTTLTAVDDTSGETLNLGRYNVVYTDPYPSPLTQIIAGFANSTGRFRAALNGPTGEELTGSAGFAIDDPKMPGSPLNVFIGVVGKR